MNYQNFIANGKKKSAAKEKPKGYEQGGPVAGPAAPAVGPISGPSTPPDTVPINATGGEFMIPAPIVHFLGEAFFKKLVADTTMEMSGGAQAPGPWDEMAQEDGGAMIPAGMPSSPPRRA
jgi:hypothetical protein